MEDFKTYLLESKTFEPAELGAIPLQLHEPLHYWLLRNYPERERQIWDCLSKFLQIAIIRPESVPYNQSLARLLPARLAHELTLAPVAINGTRITVAMADPGQFEKCDEIGLRMNCAVLGDNVRPGDIQVTGVLACPYDLGIIIKQVYGLGAETVEDVILESYYSLPDNESADISHNDRIDAGSEDFQDAAIVRFVNQLIFDAIKCQASDIHLEPYENTLQVRYRIDGVLQTESVPANIKNLEAAIISRIKIMARLDIAEKRLPQDGQIRLMALGRPIDVRVSIVPTMFGQSLVLRLLDKETAFVRFDKLGLNSCQMETLSKGANSSHGVILITGPTGSGKSTTLYSLLNSIDRHNRKVITVEDPIEYQLENVSQIQVKPEIGLSFAHCLRSILRHDPDIIMIGEIRDTETAKIAISSAMTGHLVLSTLHTNDATSAPVRLLEMGIEPYLAASALEVLAAQRLVRKLCPKCRIELPEGEHLSHVENAYLSGHKTFQAQGCFECRNTGYKGRTAIFEMFTLDQQMRNMIIERSPAEKLRQSARQAGMKTLFENGLELVGDSVTSLAELYRVVKE